jgi:predicted transposase YdaD
MGANREHKDTVFSNLFNDADTLLELYNDLTGSNYGADTKIEINTLDDVLFLDMRNDISFTIDDRVVFLVEHQSTLSENLPLRFLLYIARVYEKIVERKAAYRQKLVKIPSPELIVLYNGKSKFPNEKLLRLSDAFIDSPDHGNVFGSLDLTVRVMNINTGHNEVIVRRSEKLSGYVTFIGKIREYTAAGRALGEAIAEAVEYCIENQVLEKFLTTHSSEVLNMLTTEFKLEDAIAIWKEEGIEEGIERGREEGMLKVLALLKSGYSPEDIEALLKQEKEGTIRSEQ